MRRNSNRRQTMGLTLTKGNLSGAAWPETLPPTTGG
jgi:hypothetical protein